MKGVGDRRAGIELDDVNLNQHVYEDLDRKQVNINTYDNVQTREKTKLNDTSQLKMDKIKAVVGLLCVGMVVLVATVVTAVCLVVFAVTDGGWTNWENWGACSVTCGTGFTTRIRTCSSPRPSIMGRHCDGTSMQVLSCNKTSCLVTDGGWTNWENWGACSVTCGTGFTTRTRTCSNPRPSMMGRSCDGTPLQVLSCNNTSCSDSAIGFSVYGPDKSSSGDSLIFQKVGYNDDNVFNMTSGMFVCKQEGLSLFINTMIRLNSQTSYVSCFFYKNGVRSSYVAGYADGQAGTIPSGTSSVMFHLKPDDRVYLGSCRGTSSMDHSSSFIGFLITPSV